jgi:hypothetical protein
MRRNSNMGMSSLVVGCGQATVEGLSALTVLLITAVSLEVGTWDRFFATTSEERCVWAVPS